jgi:hypothetical protein
MLFNNVIEAEMVLKMVANRLSEGIMCDNTGGQQIIHPALTGLII